MEFDSRYSEDQIFSSAYISERQRAARADAVSQIHKWRLEIKSKFKEGCKFKLKNDNGVIKDVILKFVGLELASNSWRANYVVDGDEFFKNGKRKVKFMGLRRFLQNAILIGD